MKRPVIVRTLALAGVAATAVALAAPGSAAPSGPAF
ncbi:MAG: hypothetical protein QOE84_664, partial [Actinomycetota bacterium]|nr:hypothetical protein [Actinomycetota bacterium]